MTAPALPRDHWLALVDARVAEAGSLDALFPPRLPAPGLPLSGKRSRARLLLFAAESLGVLGDDAVTLAAAVEMVHNASLFHDDVIDHAALRRGVPTLHSTHGEKIAVMTGDLCFARAMALICRVPRLPIYDAVSRAVVELAGGQLAESVTPPDAMDLDRYFFVADRKTGSLMGLCLELPGILAGVSPAQQHSLRHAGTLLGRAFQMADDMLDLNGHRDETGKDAFRDLHEGKLTYPYLLLMNLAAPAERELIRRACGDGPIPEDSLRRMAAAYDLSGRVMTELQRMLVEIDAMLNAVAGWNPDGGFMDFCRQLAFRSK